MALINLEIEDYLDEIFEEGIISEEQYHKMIENNTRPKVKEVEKETTVEVLIKKCSKCKQNKPYTDYYKDKHAPKGIRASCKQCHKPVKKEIYQKDKEKYTQWNKEFRERNPEYQKEYHLQKKQEKLTLKNEATIRPKFIPRIAY